MECEETSQKQPVADELLPTTLNSAWDITLTTGEKLAFGVGFLFLVRCWLGDFLLLLL